MSLERLLSNPKSMLILADCIQNNLDDRAKDYAIADGSIDWKAVSKAMIKKISYLITPDECKACWKVVAYPNANGNMVESSSKKRKECTIASNNNDQSDDEDYELAHLLKNGASSRSKKQPRKNVSVTEPLHFTLPRNYTLMSLPAFRAVVSNATIRRREEKAREDEALALSLGRAELTPSTTKGKTWADQRLIGPSFSAACSNSDHATTIAKVTPQPPSKKYKART